MVEMSGREQKIEAFIDLMRPYGIIELARTGRIAPGARHAGPVGGIGMTVELTASHARPQPRVAAGHFGFETGTADSNHAVGSRRRPRMDDDGRRRLPQSRLSGHRAQHRRVPEDDIVVPLVHFTKDNGELSSIALDNNTKLEAA